MRVTSLMYAVSVIAVTAAGCGNREPTISAAGASSPSLGIASGSGSSSQSTSSTAKAGACAAAYFAANRACKGGPCVGIFEITPACTVRQVNELNVSAAGNRVVDLAWPERGPLYVVTSRDPDGPSSWGRIEHPRTATDAELAATTWTTETFGKPEPGGFSLGVETDGTSAILTGCAKWLGGEEEWSCVKRVFRTTDKAAVKRLPPPSYATAWKPGDVVVPGVTLRARRHAWGPSLECRTKTAAWMDAFHTTPIAVAAIDVDRWYLFYETAGDRNEPNIGIAAIAMKGCAPDDTLGRIVAPGPDGLSARSPEDGSGEPKWKIHRRGSTTPLTDTAGSPFRLDGASTLVWARS